MESNTEENGLTMTELPVENIEESEDNSRHPGPGGPSVDAIMAPENEVKIDSVIAKETSNEGWNSTNSLEIFSDFEFSDPSKRLVWRIWR